MLTNEAPKGRLIIGLSKLRQAQISSAREFRESGRQRDPQAGLLRFGAAMSWSPVMPGITWSVITRSIFRHGAGCAMRDGGIEPPSAGTGASFLRWSFSVAHYSSTAVMAPSFSYLCVKRHIGSICDLTEARCHTVNTILPRFGVELTFVA